MLNTTTQDEISQRLTLFFKSSSSWSEVARDDDTKTIKAKRDFTIKGKGFRIAVRTYPDANSNKWVVASLLYLYQDNQYIGCSRSGFKVESNYNLILSALCNSLETTLKRYKDSIKS